MSRRDLGLGAIFRWPLVLAILTGTGLISALLADGVWDGVGGLLVGVGLLPVIACWWRARRRSSPPVRTPG